MSVDDVNKVAGGSEASESASVADKDNPKADKPATNAPTWTPERQSDDEGARDAQAGTAQRADQAVTPQMATQSDAPYAESAENGAEGARQTSSMVVGSTAQPFAGEQGGVDGPEPTRYGDWAHRGRCTDF